MDEALAAVGNRIRSRMPHGMSQRKLAEKAQMTPDALSRALNGQRGFSSSELARIAGQLGADLHWLITGDPDPQKVDIAARHQWDPRRNVRTNPGRLADDELLTQVVATYRAAFAGGPPPSLELPQDSEKVREMLGNSFTRTFADAVEAQLGVDVIRIAGLTTDYSLTIGGRGVIVLGTMPSWFRSNWSLAHELGHLALGHHNGFGSNRSNEGPADAFAANLLLPEEIIYNEDWQDMDAPGLANFLWTTGVSTMALGNRLSSLRVKVSTEVSAALTLSTARLIRMHAGEQRKQDVTLREQQASVRRVPSTLVEALRQQVETGKVSPEFLAWALDVPVDEIDFPEPDESTGADQYSLMLEDRPSAAELEDWLAMSGPSPR